MSEPWTVPVSGTQSRPAALPFFVLGRNNLNPKVVVDGEGVTIKVVGTTRLRFAQLGKVEIRKGLRSTYVTLPAGSWEYLVHFRDEQALTTFLQRLRDGGVVLGARAAERAGG